MLHYYADVQKFAFFYILASARRGNFNSGQLAAENLQESPRVAESVVEKSEMETDKEPKSGDVFNIAEFLIQRNLQHADKLAVIDDFGQLSYGQLYEQVRRFAAALLAQGLRRDERVLLLMQDCSDWPVCFLGALYAGIVPVAVNTLLTSDDYAYMLKHSRARMALVSHALLPTLQSALAAGTHSVEKIVVSRAAAELPAGSLDMKDLLALYPPLTQAADTSADDPAFWLYSSGSTGRPKGTVHAHSSAYWTAKYYGAGILNIREADVCFSAAKLFFAYGLGNALTFPFYAGATVVLMAERPTPEACFKRWLEHRVSVFFGAPTGFAGILVSKQLPTKAQCHLRLVSSAGEALPADLGERFSAHFGVEVIDGIGSTEMLHVYLSNRPGKVRYGTTGWPVPGYEIELRSETGGAVPDGEAGDLFIKGPSAALMYWGNRSKSNDTFLGPWTKSGDKYVRNSDGSYTYSGRSDDMLKVSGIYVSPFEVESTVVEHSSVLEAAVIGITDQDGLTKTKAFVVLKPGKSVTEEELKAFVKDRLAPYKYPRSIQFVSELPKTATGKIQRFKLRELERAQSS
jgi:benzoate-CoA ligase